MSNACPRSVRARLIVAVGAALFGVPAFLHGCADLGKDLPNETGPPPPTGDAPVISDVLPMRTFSGDTVQVAGVRFGATAGHVLFTGTALRGDVEATIVSWADDKITALVPAAASGPIRVQAGGIISQGAEFSTVPEVLFGRDVTPLFDFQVNGGHDCVSCHGFCEPACTGGFEILPYDRLMQGSATGIVVIPRRSASSRLIQVLLPTTPVGSRMPQSTVPFYMSDAEIQLISDWIDQGARSN
ncbi:MAG: IPT/TIG domain-containing protein [bacterium]